jgi:PAS domain-containing protein
MPRELRAFRVAGCFWIPSSRRLFQISLCKELVKLSILRCMDSSGQGSERLNTQLLVDSIPGLIHTSRPDGYLDYFNKPWLEYLGVTLDKATGWNWTAFVHPEDVEGIVRAAKSDKCGLDCGLRILEQHSVTYWE